RVTEQEWILPVVVPPYQFIQIGVEMLLADLMIGADDRAFQKAPHALNGVGMHLPPYPFLLRVIDGQVLRVLVSDAFVCLPLVGDDLPCFVVGKLVDEAMQRQASYVRDHAHADITTTLHSTGNDRFVGTVETTSESSALLAADEGFIHFDNALEQFRLHFRHGGSNPMAEIPRSLVRHA